MTSRSRRVLAIDPGPLTCGVVWYVDGAVTGAKAALPVEDVLRVVATTRYPVACERVQSYGVAGASLLRTAEVYGRIEQAAAHAGVPHVGVYRREVLAALDVSGRGTRDARVRQRLIEMHGGSRAVAVGTRAAPGPLYGVTSHAWQALAVAVVALDRMSRGRPAEESP